MEPTPSGFRIGWTARDPSVRSRSWADPLGLRQDEGELASRIVPLFRKRHGTVVGFGLLCFALAGSRGPDTERLLHIERMWTLARVRADHPWAGSRAARRALAFAEHDL